MTATQNMDHHQLLIKLTSYVARAFYDSKYIMIIDILNQYKAIKDDELVYKLRLNIKDVQKMCGKLKEDRFVVVARKNEIGLEDNKPVPKTYYIMDYKSIVDVTKWKILSIRKLLSEKLKQKTENLGFECSNCTATYSMLDAHSLMNFEVGKFLCEICEFELVHSEIDLENDQTQILYNNMYDMIRQITEILKQTEKIEIEEITQVSMKKIIEQTNNNVNSTSKLNQGISFAKDSNVKAIVKLNLLKRNIDIQNYKKQILKNKKTLINEMPVWHTKSTVKPLSSLSDANNLGLSVYDFINKSNPNKRKPSKETSSAKKQKIATKSNTEIEDEERKNFTFYKKYYDKLIDVTSVNNNNIS